MRALAIVVALTVAPSLVSAEDDPLKAARDLYASAAYEEALAELTRVESGAATPATTRESDAYRAFCLVALGRAAEAQAVAESVVRRDPTLSIDQFPDASPRIAAMFTSVQQRVLPQLVKDEYRAARSLAAEDAPEAESRLRHVRQLLGTAEKIGAWDDTLADLRLLVDGFLDLAHATEPRHAAADAKPAAAVIDPSPARPSAVTLASSTDAGIVPPTAVFQPQPNVPRAVLDLVRMLHLTGTVDVLINEQGTVDGVTVTQPVNPAYDRLIVAAVRTWRYKPALKNGVPVKFVNTVAFNASEK